MPVYNGEKLIERAISSILDQTYGNFELTISDNGSTDKTAEICKKYSLKDDRIKYIRHEKNSGGLWNYKFLLNNAKNEYFMWAPVDDLWSPEFIEKNLNFLEKNKNFVGSIGKVKTISLDGESNKIDDTFEKFLRKIRFRIRPVNYQPISGSYEKKVSDFLKYGYGDMTYGLFRTSILQKSYLDINFGIGMAYASILHALKFGDFNVIDEYLFSKSDKGISKKGIIYMARHVNSGIGKLFTHYHYTLWCAKNLGAKIFIKNLSYFIQLNLWAVFATFVDLFRILSKSINSKKEN